MRLPGGVTHFVVIAGKDGFDYLIADPGAGSAKGLYPLRELGSDIEALRFYEPIANANSQPPRKSRCARGLRFLNSDRIKQKVAGIHRPTACFPRARPYSTERFHYLLVARVAAHWIQLGIILGPIHFFVTEVREASLE